MTTKQQKQPVPAIEETRASEAFLLEQESLRAVIESISGGLELQPLLERIVRHACALIGADNGTIGLVDNERDLVRTEAVYRMPPSEIGAEMPRGVGLAGQVLATERPLVLQRYGEVQSPTQSGLLENAVVGLPIYWQERLIGVFGIGSEPKDGKPAPLFTQRDIDTLAQFARHAAIAIENARLFDTTQHSLQDTQLLYETSTRLSAAVTEEEIIRAYLEQVAAGGRYACTIALYDRPESPNSLPVAVVVRGAWTPQEGLRLFERRHPYTNDALDGPLDAGETVTISDVHTDPRTSEALREIQRESGRPALAMIPLLVRGERMGLVILSSPHRQVWSESVLRRFQATAAHLATALDRRRQQLLVLERGQQVAVLEERQRLARELHDSVTQLLFSTTLVAQSVAPVWRRGDTVEGERRLDRVLDLTHTALAEMRALLGNLNAEGSQTATSPITGAEHLRQQGLVVALKESIRNLAVPTGGADAPRVTLASKNYPQGELALDAEEALLRIASEALANALRHANARNICVRITSNGFAVRLSVEDDGAGFPEPGARSAKAGNGMGLDTMRERASEVGGELQIETHPSSGTTISVTLPLPSKSSPHSL